MKRTPHKTSSKANGKTCAIDPKHAATVRGGRAFDIAVQLPAVLSQGLDYQHNETLVRLNARSAQRARP